MLDKTFWSSADMDASLGSNLSVSLFICVFLIWAESPVISLWLELSGMFHSARGKATGLLKCQKMKHGRTALISEMTCPS